MQVNNELKRKKPVVKPVFVDKKDVRYNVVTELHGYFRCKRCEKIFDVQLEETDLPKFRGNPDLSPNETQVYFLGACKKCEED